MSTTFFYLNYILKIIYYSWEKNYQFPWMKYSSWAIPLEKNVIQIARKIQERQGILYIYTNVYVCTCTRCKAGYRRITSFMFPRDREDTGKRRISPFLSLSPFLFAHQSRVVRVYIFSSSSTFVRIDRFIY